MKTLFVGDVHGKVEVVERAFEQEYPVVFVGDILDSYDRSVEDHIKCLELIFKGIDSGKAQCLWGNHELSYFVPKMCCSGFNAAMLVALKGGLDKEIEKRFKHFLFLQPNILVTHGGLDKTLWDKYSISLKNLEETLNNWSRDINSPAYDIGYSRGGTAPVGGIYWNDFQREHTPIPELIQIVGHTRGKGCRVTGTTTCIDYNDYQSDLFYMEV